MADKVLPIRHPTTWKVRHLDLAFTGFFGGIDFVNGIGSTSSVLDICHLLDLNQGFKVIADEQAQREFKILRDALRPKPPVKIAEKEGAWKALR